MLKKMYAQLMIPNVMTIKSKHDATVKRKKSPGITCLSFSFAFHPCPKTSQTNSPAAPSPCHHNPVIALVADAAAVDDVAATGLATAAGH